MSLAKSIVIFLFFLQEVVNKQGIDKKSSYILPVGFGVG